MDSKQMMMRNTHLATLTTHLRRYEKPANGSYDAFSTSYISGDIPWRKILSDEIDDASSVDSMPFSPKFEIEKFSLQEKERKLRGKSVRNKILLPSSEEIYGHFKQAEILDREEHLGYLYFKAMQYSILNHARALDESYPRPDPDAIRSTFSEVHQKVVAAMKKDIMEAAEEQRTLEELKKEATIRNNEGIFRIPTIQLACDESRMMATASEQEDLKLFRQVIQNALDKPTAFKDFQAHKEPWQFKAETGRSRIQILKKKKLPWKKNIYPPKSIEEKIAKLRSMAPPLQPEHLETDQLPGIWEPELMIASFKTAYMEAQDEQCEEYKEDWWTVFNTNKKCLKWLNSIPDSL